MEGVAGTLVACLQLARHGDVMAEQDDLLERFGSGELRKPDRSAAVDRIAAGRQAD